MKAVLSARLPGCATRSEYVGRSVRVLDFSLPRLEERGEGLRVETMAGKGEPEFVAKPRSEASHPGRCWYCASVGRA